MGVGVVVIVVLAGLGLFLARKLGWLDIVLTLGNRARSRFSRASAEGETVFRTTPARPSLVAIAAIALGLWMLIWLWPTLGMLSIFGFIPLVMGVMALLIGLRHRRPATITLSPEGLRRGAQHWPLADIAAINVRMGSRIRTDEPAPLVHQAAGGGLAYGGKPTALMLSRSLNRRAVERSYLVTLRTRAGSKEAVLSGGLTAECAEALASDLREVMKAF